ncbi:casein kinase I isoform delta [Cercophora scortea]|uniref:non-specific serine/threonine protein kinase n=1 Tax=Cercophora scortea TaxID=314031 RepID=A0AAE0I2F7_9PEZI|nr:casein kinase I isoform delta [Cercophora scortea]
MKDIIIQNGRYRVDRKIGKGGFGEVWAGFDLQLNEEVAMKLTPIGKGPDTLRLEADTYKALAGGVGIPHVRWFGSECEYYVLIEELLGPSLEDLFNYCGRKFSLKTVLLIADQAICRIQYIHSKGVLHRDIKPDNFLMGLGKQGNILYTVDFGLAGEFSDAEHSNQHYHRVRALAGTTRYATLNNHNGRVVPRTILGDDLESLGYMLFYFARGSLPWQGMKAATERERDKLIKEKKMSLSGEDLCGDVLPAEFATYLNYTRALGFNDKPNYAYLRNLFRRRFKAEGFKYDNVFDWTVKRYNEIHGGPAVQDEPTSTSPPKKKSRKPTRKQKRKSAT